MDLLLLPELKKLIDCEEMQLKKFALYLTGLLLLALFDLSAAQAEKFIPSSSPMVIRLDANRLLKMPIRNMLDKKKSGNTKIYYSVGAN